MKAAKKTQCFDGTDRRYNGRATCRTRTGADENGSSRYSDSWPCNGDEARADRPGQNAVCRTRKHQESTSIEETLQNILDRYAFKRMLTVLSELESILHAGPRG